MSLFTQLFVFRIEDGGRDNIMFNHHIKIKTIFLIGIFVIFLASVSGISYFKYNPYFTYRYIKKNFDYISLLLNGKINIENNHNRTNVAYSVPVLLYHGVTKNPDGSNILLEDFKNQMFTLKKAGWQTVTLEDFYKFTKGEKELPDKSFLLTFDDGRKDSYYPVDPILKALNYNAVMFIITERSIVDFNTFHLTKHEIKQMINNGRWEIQSHGKNAHTFYDIDVSVKPGHFYSNKLLVKKENRLETDDEFITRISDDFLSSKNNIEKEFGIKAISLAFPYGDFGEGNLNYSDINMRVLGESKKFYDIIFYQYWPRVNDGFRSNYFTDESYNFIRKRINVSPTWTSDELLNLMEASQNISLPYIEKFDNTKRWIDIFGDVSVSGNNKELIIFGKNGSGATYLDGSYFWKNYQYNTTIKEVEENISVSLLARYHNSLNYVSCQFDDDAIIIKNVDDGNVKILNEIKITGKYTIRNGRKIGIEANKDEIKCILDNLPLLQIKNSEIGQYGGIGIKIWNNGAVDQKLIISDIVVNNLNDISDIINKYSSSINGKEIVYKFLDKGDLKIADEYLDNFYAVDRFEPIKINPPITWKENPNNEPYWRFNFYNLTSTRHLLYAWTKTGNKIYLDKLIEIMNGFIDDGMNGSYSWDYHGTAFRTMVFVNTWWKLRETNVLSNDFGRKVLEALKVHGDFLVDESHYEPDYNHGLDQAIALYVLAVNFPDLSGADKWLAISKERLIKITNDIIDADGVLVENSPYYHFYALNKYWELFNYLKNNNLSLGDEFDKNLNNKIKKMISYGVYILQPNLEIPIIGASLKSKINLSDNYEEMANFDSNFLYVLTKGRKGKLSLKRNIFYPATGQTIMRSGWDNNEKFEKQTQIIFDVGDYRTDHSDLDALSFSLFSRGVALIPDSGLYTYEDGPYRDYFHGTLAHNTVVVDGQNQKKGSAIPGIFYEKDDFVYQSAQHNLYDGVIHQRAISLIKDDIVLVIDNLISNEQHKYEQKFHFAPELKLDVNGLIANASGSLSEQSITIYQLVDNGITVKSVKGENNPPAGLCSEEYEKAIPCYDISYVKNAKTATYITVLKIGKHNNFSAKINESKNNVIIESNDKKYSIKIGKSTKIDRKISVSESFNTTDLFSKEKTPLSVFSDINSWQFNSNGKISLEDENIKVISSADGLPAMLIKNINTDLSHQNISFKLKVDNIKNISQLKISLSNNNFFKTASLNLKSEIYTKEYDGEWITVGLAKSKYRSETLGGWKFNNPNFDWSKIDKIRFDIAAVNGEMVSTQFSDFSLISEQKEAVLSIIFDDGWSSILNVLPIMQKYGIKGNVAVMKDAVGKKNYLSLEQIKEMQNVYGWNIVNHSARHKNAVKDYYQNNNLADFENDIIDNLEYLIDNSINSAPNWYIYPYGDTNNEIKNIVGKYYKFARGTSNATEAFPFADPLNVKILAVDNTVNPEYVNDAIRDGIENKYTLIFMLHKLESPPALATQYSVQDVEKIIKYIVKSGIKVRTLTEIDRGNNVPISEFSVIKAVPEQIILEFNHK